MYKGDKPKKIHECLKDVYSKDVFDVSMVLLDTWGPKEH